LGHHTRGVIVNNSSPGGGEEVNAKFDHSKENSDPGEKAYATPEVTVHGKVETITGQPAPPLGGSLEDTAEDLDTVDDD